MRLFLTIIFLLLGFHSSACAPNLGDTTEGTLTCNYFGRTWQSMAVRTSEEDLIRLADLDFQVSPFLPSQLSCARWLETIWNAKGMDQIWKVRPTISNEGIREGRLIDDQRVELYQRCFDSELCRVRFPYNIGWWRLKRLFSRDSFAPFGLNQPLCESSAHPRQVTARALNEVKAIHEGGLAEAAFWTIPESELADQIIEMIQREQEGTIFVATMSASSGEIEKIVAALADYPLVTVFLLFDAAVSASGYDIHQWIQSDSDQLYLVPISPRPDRPAFFHLKGAASWGGKGWIVFTAANLVNHLDGSLADLGLTAQEKSVADALAKVFADQIREACMEPEYLTCTLKARTTDEDPLRYQMRAALAESCRAFFDAGLSVQLAAVTNPYFLVTTEDDVVDFMTALVGSAKRSVVGFSNRVDSWPLVVSLKQAHVKGKAVDLYSGRKGDNPIWQVKDFQPILHVASDGSLDGRISHAKFAIIDDRAALWGTGNFTKNGLAEATELFFLTDHPALIEALRDYAATWSRPLPSAEVTDDALTESE